MLEAERLREPVKLAKALIDLGLSLKRAHGVVDRLACGERTVVELPAENAESAIARLRQFGLAVFALQIGPFDPKRIREKQNLSQSEFAVLYGLDDRTLQNWEQRRNEPDTPARVLLTIIEREPELVLRALYNIGPQTSVTAPDRDKKPT